MVDKQNIPKSTHLHKKLPSAIKFFRELRELNPSLQCTTDDVLPDALCDTTVSPPVEETIESDATPMSSLQEDAPDATPVQEDASPPPDAPPAPLQEDAPDATPMSSVQEDASPPPDATPVQEDASPQPDAPETKRPSRTNSTATKAFFKAMWKRVLPKLMAKKKSRRDYMQFAIRITNGDEPMFPLVQTVDDLLNVFRKLKGNTCKDITSTSKRNRARQVIIAVNGVLERVGFDAARDYFLQNGAETAHPVSCA
jgi:hypothetical protein